MKTNVLIIQRFYYNFREGFYEYLSDIDYKFTLINSVKSSGRIKVHSDCSKKPFILKTFSFIIKDYYVIFPFLFFKLLILNPQIIVSEGGQNTINNLWVYLYCKLFKKKYIIWDLGKGYANFKDSTFRVLYMTFYKFILKNSIYIYGYNNQSKDYFTKLGIERNKIVVLNNTTDTRKIKDIIFNPINITPADISHLNNTEKTFLIFVGSLSKGKNIESMVDLLKMLGEKYYLIIVGDGSEYYKNDLKMLFDNLNCIFVGYKKIDELYPYYKLASFSILPGLGGLAINQAMAFGVPVICCHADGAEKDLVINDKTGFIYNNLEEAYNYIISKNDKSWTEMGKNAQTLLFTEHSVENMMNKFIKYLNI